MPGMDSIRPASLGPPPAPSGKREVEPVGKDAPGQVRRDSVEISSVRPVGTASGERSAAVAGENARAFQAPEPAVLANDYGRAAASGNERVRFFSVDGGLPSPLEILQGGA